MIYMEVPRASAIWNRLRVIDCSYMKKKKQHEKYLLQNVLLVSFVLWFSGCVSVQWPSATRVNIKTDKGVLRSCGMKNVVLCKNKCMCIGYLEDEHILKIRLAGTETPVPSWRGILVELGSMNQPEASVYLWIERNALPGNEGHVGYHLLKYKGVGTVSKRRETGFNIHACVKNVSNEVAELEIECRIHGKQVSESEFTEFAKQMPEW